MVSGDASDFYALADRLDRAPARIRGRATKDVGTWSHDTENVARSGAPVRSGELRDGIHASARGLVGEVVSEAGHSEYVEDGTSDTPPQPFMRPAVERTTPTFEEAFAKGPEEYL